MKTQRAIRKFLFILNSLVAILLLFSYFLPFISPKTFPALAVLSLGVPILIILNIVFFIYWLLRRKKELCISLVTLILGFNYVTSLFLISGKSNIKENNLLVMSYNVKGFSNLGWKNKSSTSVKIFDFIKTEDPDVLAIQEYYINSGIDHGFPYQYIKTKEPKSKFGYAVFSKYEIVHSGSLDFEGSQNNTIFADLKIDSDTVRVYNVHLESLGVNPNKENFGQENSEKLYRRLKRTFSKQAQQTALFLTHKNAWKGKSIICGDLNNTAFSWVYNEISDGMKDAFLEAGRGFGKTYNYPYPLRIDFILTDESFVTDNYKTHRIQYSDHFPIMANLH
ncbi:endonuclease/exonuclease/phosphatase family protein [Flavobacteriaceae bacterium S356]|uniref:Endonuclease/exonuclease/phosphatase family protein n=1 Tax=Asprobacillus argus TaxID=3076534 RepID=A0ABU3LG93_9FLAO|nr:endonuclease/exonuclease/phosphatase family protein [Flavobacteriaceae bacterium S356]